MKRIALVAAVLAIPSMVQAATISENAIVRGAGQVIDEGYVEALQFAPLAITGTVTSVVLSFTGSVAPGIQGNPTASVATVTLTPYAGLTDNDIPGTPSANPLPIGFGFSELGWIGTPETLPYNGLQTVGAIAQQVTFSSTSTSFTTAELNSTLATPSNTELSFFSALNGSTCVGGGNGCFLGLNTQDRSTGGGVLTLTVNYDPIPEPASLSLLGMGLVGMAMAKRTSGQG